MGYAASSPAPLRFANGLDGSRLRRALLVAVLLAMHVLLALSALANKSHTFDEIAHVTRGVSIWRTGDYRLLPESPPFIHLWTTWPLLTEDVTFPSTEDEAWRTSNPWLFSRAFFYETGNPVDAMMRRSRGLAALVSVAVGVLVWCWSRRLFGTPGAMISLGLFCFSPTVLAHGSLVTTDLAASFFFLAATGTLARCAHRVTLGTVLSAAVALGGLALSKMSAVLIVPVALVLALLGILGPQPLTLRLGRTTLITDRRHRALIYGALGMLLVILVGVQIWAAYGFRFSALREPHAGDHLFMAKATSDDDPWERVLEGLGGEGRVIRWARDCRLLPEAHLFGLAYTLQRAQSREGFLNGERRREGWWYFFPYCFLVKTSLPTLLLAALAGLLAVKRALRPAVGPRFNREFAPLWILLLIYAISATGSNLNIGHRHILPLYPILFILVGSLGRWLVSPTIGRRWTVGALLLALSTATFTAWPHYLSYVNLLGGGSAHGYRHLVDSSLDWGQDLPGLARRLRTHRTGSDRVFLSYFGTAHPPYYGIEATMLPSYLPWQGGRPAPLTGGIYCLSATTLQQVGLLPNCRWRPEFEQAYQQLRQRIAQSSNVTSVELENYLKLAFGRLCVYLREREPDDHVGHSILIYRLTDDQVRSALNDPIG